MLFRDCSLAVDAKELESPSSCRGLVYFEDYGVLWVMAVPLETGRKGMWITTRH